MQALAQDLDTLDRLELDTYLEIEQRTYDLVREFLQR